MLPMSFTSDALQGDAEPVAHRLKLLREGRVLVDQDPVGWSNRVEPETQQGLRHVRGTLAVNPGEHVVGRPELDQGEVPVAFLPHVPQEDQVQADLRVEVRVPGKLRRLTGCGPSHARTGRATQALRRRDRVWRGTAQTQVPHQAVVRRVRQVLVKAADALLDGWVHAARRVPERDGLAPNGVLLLCALDRNDLIFRRVLDVLRDERVLLGHVDAGGVVVQDVHKRVDDPPAEEVRVHLGPRDAALQGLVLVLLVAPLSQASHKSHMRRQ